MKFPLLKLALAGTMALSLAACNDMNREGTGIQDEVQQNNVGQNKTRTFGFNNDLGMRGAGNNRLVQNDRDVNYDHGFLNGWNARNNGKDNRWNNNATSPHNNTRMDMNNDLADQIAGIRGVRWAGVLTTDNNAYVAVVLDNTSQGNGNKNNNTVTLRGMPGNSWGNDRMLNRNGDVSQAMKTRIADIIQSAEPSIRDVYITANPGFVDRMRGYTQSVENGRPIRGLILEFNEMAERLFPANAGSDNNLRLNGNNDYRNNNR